MEKWKLPEGWKYVQLHDLCAQITDGTHKTPNYKKDGVRFISIQNLRRFAPIDWGAYVRFVSLEEHAYLVKRVRPEKGDVLVTKIGTLGVAKVIDFDEEVSIFVGLALLKPKRELIDGKYLEAVLNSPAYVQLAYEKARGAGRKTLPLVELNKFPIPIPYPDDPVRSLAEQRRIVARLEALLGEVREMRALQAQIEADVGRLMGAVLAEVFEQYDSGLRRPISAIADVKGGKRLPKGESFASGVTDHPYLRVTDFRDFSIDTHDLKYLTHEIYQKIRRYTISINDIYISIAGTIGLVGTIPRELNGANLTENAAKIVFKPEYKGQIDKEFVVFYLASSFGKRQIEERSKAAGQPKLALMRIETIEIPVLQSLVEQQRVVAYIKYVLEEIEAMRTTVESDSKALDALEQSILAQAFRGEA